MKNCAHIESNSACIDKAFVLDSLDLSIDIDRAFKKCLNNVKQIPRLSKTIQEKARLTYKDIDIILNLLEENIEIITSLKNLHGDNVDWVGLLGEIHDNTEIEFSGVGVSDFLDNLEIIEDLFADD